MNFYIYWRLKCTKIVISEPLKWQKWQFLSCDIPQYWFHIISEWHKNAEFFTLWRKFLQFTHSAMLRSSTKFSPRCFTYNLLMKFPHYGKCTRHYKSRFKARDWFHVKSGWEKILIFPHLGDFQFWPIMRCCNHQPVLSGKVAILF